MDDLLGYLAPALRPLVQEAARRAGPGLEEIRLRSGQPIHLVLGGADSFVTAGGGLSPEARNGRPVTADEVEHAFQLLCRGSVYAWEEELRGGFITLPGGHRVGISGRALVSGGRLQAVRPVTGLNLRLARSVPGVALPLWPHVFRGGEVLSTLLLSAPQAGKTTLLRDLVRLAAGQGRCKVAVVDERSELAGCAGGQPRLDLGPRTDVLDGCPKAEGMMLCIRALSPQVLAVDEIGRDEDARAVEEAALAGVAVLATAHAGSLVEALRRPSLRGLLSGGIFRRVALLSRRAGPGTVEQVWDIPPSGGSPQPLPLCTGAAGGRPARADGQPVQTEVSACGC